MSTDDRESGGGGEYLVIARRYRPQTFDDLIGQEHVARALKHAIATGRVGHAYLFTGSRGVGKTSAARILAKALNCVNGPTPTPCNECDVCQSVTIGDDVDVIEIDGASNRQIDDIRQLRQNVSVRPSRVRFKVYIIDEVHMLTKEAFNALLKTLEEPPEHVKFIFATTDPQKVPITILSRCQRFDFAGIDSSAIEQRLAQIAASEGVDIEPEALALLAIRAAGSMRDSQSLLEQLLAGCDKHITAADVNQLLGIAPAQRLSKLVDCLASRDAGAALAELDGALLEGADPGQLVDQLIGYFRDIMAAEVGCDARQFRFALPSQAEQVKELARQIGLETVLAMVSLLDETAARLRVSIHSRTLTEMALVRICHLHDLDNLADLVARVEQSPASTPSSSPPRMSPSRAAPQQATAPSPSARKTPLPTASQQPAELSPGGVTDLWQRTVTSLEGLLADNALLADRVELASDGAIVANYTSDNQFSHDYCSAVDQHRQIEQALSSVAGGKVTVRFVLEAASPNGPAKAAPPRPKSRRELQGEVAERGFVRQAMELFDTDLSRMKVIPPRGDAT